MEYSIKMKGWIIAIILIILIIVVILFTQPSSPTNNAMINTVVGNGIAGYRDNVVAIQAELFGPSSVAFDSLGNMYISDSGNKVIRKVTKDGKITTFAGSKTVINEQTNGPVLATNVNLLNPFGVTVDKEDNVYIVDKGNLDIRNSVIRKVDKNRYITTVAGGGPIHYIPNTNNRIQTYYGDGGLATDATLYSPSSVVVDSLGNIFIADTQNNVIRKVDLEGKITTIAGTGPIQTTDNPYQTGSMAIEANLSEPTGLALDGSNNLYVTDSKNSVVSKIDTKTGMITIVAGNFTYDYTGDGGQAIHASLYTPCGIVLDGSGNMYLSDTRNNVIRSIDPSGIIRTYAGSEFTGNIIYTKIPVYDPTKPFDHALSAQLFGPGLLTFHQGSLYIPDTNHHIIRIVGEKVT